MGRCGAVWGDVGRCGARDPPVLRCFSPAGPAGENGGAAEEEVREQRPIEPHRCPIDTSLIPHRAP